MAGSPNHLVRDQADEYGPRGSFRLDTIDNMGDALEACEECFYVIVELSGGDQERINEALRKLRYPTISCSLVPESKSEPTP